MRRFAIALSMLLVLFNVSFSQSDVATYVAEDGMFSFTIPRGWVLREAPGRKYKVAVGQRTGAFTPNINVVDESYSGPLDTYVDGNLRVIPLMYQKVGYKNFRVISRSEFVTTTKQTGVRVVTSSEPNNTPIRQTFFFFNGKEGKKLVVTCTTLAAGGERYDSLFEQSLKTFRSEARHSSSTLSGF